MTGISLSGMSPRLAGKLISPPLHLSLSLSLSSARIYKSLSPLLSPRISRGCAFSRVIGFFIVSRVAILECRGVESQAGVEYSRALVCRF